MNELKYEKNSLEEAINWFCAVEKNCSDVFSEKVVCPICSGEAYYTKIHTNKKNYEYIAYGYCEHCGFGHEGGTKNVG